MGNGNNKNSGIGEVVNSILCGKDNSPLKRISENKLQCIKCSTEYDITGMRINPAINHGHSYHDERTFNDKAREWGLLQLYF
jgi:hypothetical protein